MRTRFIALAGFAVGALSICALLGAAVAQECDPNDPTLILPDLAAQPPLRARVVERDGIRRVYFSTVIANVGKGPFQVVGKTVTGANGQQVTNATQVVQRSDGSTCTHDAGEFVYHPSHHHWHINDFATYTLWDGPPFAGGHVVASAFKVSFCLIDVESLRGFSGQRQVDSQCGLQEGTQGISSGWADVYDDFFPDQWIDLDVGQDPPVPPGAYYLVNTADPDALFLETDTNPADSSGIVPVDVPRRIATGPIPTATPTQDLTGIATPTPARPVPSGPPHPAHPAQPAHPVHQPHAPAAVHAPVQP